MESEEKIPLINLSIYLIKDLIVNVEDIINLEKVDDEEEILDNGKIIGHLYIKSPYDSYPKWSKIFEGYFDTTRFGQVSSSSAVLLISQNDRKFTITFGQGRYLLQQECWEERFGLKVALNSVEENSIKSLDKKSFDDISMITREQASREISAQDFGLDIEKDLLRAVVGYSADKKLGERISGMDSFKTAVRASLPDVKDLCSIYLKKFHDKTYKSKYPWVDHLSEIKHKKQIEELDNEMVKHINDKKFDRCWTCIPEIIDWNNIAGFKYGFSPKSYLHHDIHLIDFLKERMNDDQVYIQNLKNRYVHAVTDEDNKINSWSIYYCIYCEIDFKNEMYLLSGSKWYKVDNDFVSKVNAYYNSIPRSELTLPEYDHNSEAEYNFDVSIQNNEFALMDRKLIQYGGGKIEFCDLFDQQNHIIHVKRYGASSVLSHLFMQGVNSGELFQSEQEFREKINNNLPDSHKISDVINPPDQNKYEIVYAIISDSDGSEIDIPFFSKLTFRNSVKRLYGYRYKVSIMKIPVSDQLKKTKKVQSKKSI